MESADRAFFNSPRVHFQRNALAHAGKSGRRGVSPFIATAFAQDTAEAASTRWRAVADQIRPKVPKLATLMDDPEHDVRTYMSFPKEPRAKLHSTNPIERLNGEIKRRTDDVGVPAFLRAGGSHALTPERRCHRPPRRCPASRTER